MPAKKPDTFLPSSRHFFGVRQAREKLQESSFDYTGVRFKVDAKSSCSKVRSVCMAPWESEHIMTVSQQRIALKIGLRTITNSPR